MLEYEVTLLSAASFTEHGAVNSLCYQRAITLAFPPWEGLRLMMDGYGPFLIEYLEWDVDTGHFTAVMDDLPSRNRAEAEAWLTRGWEPDGWQEA